MKFSTKVSSFCHLTPSSFSSHFHPQQIQQLYNFVWCSLSQHDCSKMRFLHSKSSPISHWLELEVNIVSSEMMSQVMMTMSPSKTPSSTEKDEKQRNNTSAATDVLSFPDPVITSLFQDFSCSNNNNDDTNNNTQKIIMDGNLNHENFLKEHLIDESSCSSSCLSSTSCGVIFMCPEEMIRALKIRQGIVTMNSATKRRRRKCNQVATVDEYLLCAATHSLLHIYGYRHDTDEELDEMLRMEKKVARTCASWF